jgi:serine phosphatase RsbU (regulator of sigma subunit)
VPEAAGDDGYFGIERLEEAIARHRGGGAALLDGLLGSVDAFTLGHPLEDDVTLLTLSVGLPGLG